MYKRQPVHNGCQVVGLKGAGRHGCLPDLALGDLAIPYQHVSPAVQMIQPLSQGHAQANGEPLSQGTCAGLDTGGLLQDVYKRQ